MFSRNPSTKLLAAAKKGKLHNTEKSIASGALVDTKNEWGETPLMLASKNGHTEVAALLIEHGADVKNKANGGRTALVFAAQENRTATAALLIEKGANINQGDKAEITPLMWAILHKHVEMTRLLVDKGADVGKVNKYGRTARDLAAQIKFAEGAAILASAGKKPKISSAQKAAPPRRYKDSDRWTVLGPATIAHARVREETQEKITHTFNFAGRQRTISRENLTTRLKTKGEPQSFDVLDKDYLWNAIHHYRHAGRKVDEEFTFKGKKLAAPAPTPPASPKP